MFDDDTPEFPPLRVAVQKDSERCHRCGRLVFRGDGLVEIYNGSHTVTCDPCRGLPFKDSLGNRY